MKLSSKSENQKKNLLCSDERNSSIHSLFRESRNSLTEELIKNDESYSEIKTKKELSTCRFHYVQIINVHGKGINVVCL